MLQGQQTVNEIAKPARCPPPAAGASMTCSMEKILSDARLLVNRLKDHDVSADGLIGQSQSLYKRVDAMKQYQDDINQLNEMARHRPRANLIMGLLQENNQIRELQQENRDLRQSLEEHQSALELIMSKYREQVVKLMSSNRLVQNALPVEDNAEVIQEKIDKICEMAAVMQRAVAVDEAHQVAEQQMLIQLRLENNTLRELLRISTMNQAHAYQVSSSDATTQTAAGGLAAGGGGATVGGGPRPPEKVASGGKEQEEEEEEDEEEDEDEEGDVSSSWSDSFHSQEMNNTIIRVPKKSKQSPNKNSEGDNKAEGGHVAAESTEKEKEDKEPAEKDQRVEGAEEKDKDATSKEQP